MKRQRDPWRAYGEAHRSRSWLWWAAAGAVLLLAGLYVWDRRHYLLPASWFE